MIPYAKLAGGLALVIAFAGWTGGVYWKGGEAPRAQLAAVAEAQAKQRMHELRNKERTDAEYTRRDADLRRTIARLRERPVDVAGERPASSRCPDGQLCYDRAEFERAYGELVREIRELAAEGSALALELEVAEEWAHGD